MNCDNELILIPLLYSAYLLMIGKKTVFCRCWESKKFPLCDGAHGKHNQRCGDNLGPIIITKSE